MTTVISLLCGTLLGTRYTVLCLLPAMLIAGVAVTGFDRLYHVPLGSTAVSVVVLSVALQFGYLIGAVLRFALHAPPTAAIGTPDHLQSRTARIS